MEPPAPRRRATYRDEMALISENDMLHGSPLPGWRGRFFHSTNMTFARWTISTDAQDLHEHHHEQEEIWNVVEGSIALTVDGIEMLVGSGDAAVIPPNTPHSARIVGPAEVVVTDFPLRHDLPGVDRT